MATGLALIVPKSDHQIAKGAQGVVKEVGPWDRKVLIHLLKIPNRPDCSVEKLGLHSIVGQERLDRVGSIVDTTRSKLGITYDRFREALIEELEPSPS